MSYSVIPTMAQAMFNKTGTTVHARGPKTDAGVEGRFETLLTAVGNQGAAHSGETAGMQPAPSGGLWSTLLSGYLKTGLSGQASLSDRSVGMGSAAIGALLQATRGAKAVLDQTDGICTTGRKLSAGSANRGGAAIGALSAAFESGAAGTDAVGYDPGGGTSYGVYQIASRPGTMARFIDFLDAEAPAWAERLRAAGDPDTGGTTGEMPRVWKAIASEDPAGFTGLQHAFIEATHYRPAERKIAENTGLMPADRSEALREVVWSTAVQHGPDGAARIFQTAVERLRAGGGDVSDAAIIEQIYALRADTAAGHDPALASALRNRFREEKRQSLDLLAAGGNAPTAVG